jgi:hypothetical protein
MGSGDHIGNRTIGLGGGAMFLRTDESTPAWSKTSGEGGDRLIEEPCVPA